MFHRKSEDIEKLIKEAKKYEPSFDKGLSSIQVKERLEHNLVNKQRKTVTKSYAEIIFKNVFTILNILLISIAIVMIVFNLYNRIFFVLILLLNIGISLFQDIKARKLVGKLSLMSSPRTTVVRDGVKKEIPFNELVLSDVFVVEAGNTIPSDAIVLHGTVRMNESLLSGEVQDVVKHEGDKLYAESVVTSGFAYARVYRIGNANYASRLQEKARAFSRPKSEILASLTTIIRIISIAAISIGVMEIITYAVTGKTAIDAVDSVTSSVVAMIPIGMYLLTSITLTVGVIILSRHRILVRELYSIEMLARVNVICLDKTGTLTDGNMKLTQVAPLKNVKLEHIEEIISHLLYITQDNNLTAKALKEKYPAKEIKGHFAVIPFSSDRKFSAASFNKHTYALGAYGFIKVNNDNVIKKAVKYYEEGGHRVLIVAESKGNIINNELPKGLEAIAILVLTEQIKKDAKANIDWFKNNDVDVRIVSGDSVMSIQAIAKEVGIVNYKKAISLEGLNDAQVKKAVHDHTIFARVTPEQKKVVINELQAMHNTVAMVGDGVNDLLALKSADCSIAMASGSDAAKAVAHLVSMDSNFSSLPKVVEEGRRVINNLQRVCSIFLVKTIFAIFMSLLFLVISWFNHDVYYPFRTNHLMAWEFLTIGIAPFFVALEPNRERIKGGFIRNIISEAIPGAFIQLFITLPLLSASFINASLFPMDAVMTMSVILMSAMSLVIFLHVCLPLNKYRGIVLGGTCLLMIAMFVMDVCLTNNHGQSYILDINYFAFNTPTLIFGIVSFVVGIPLYFLVAFLFQKFIRKKVL